MWIHTFPQAKYEQIWKSLKEREVALTLKKQGMLFKKDIEV